MKIRSARMCDAAAICEIVNYHAERGRMLHRSMEAVYDLLRNFLVAEVDGQVVGCVATQIIWADLAEVKSLAVHHEHIGRRIGRQLVAAAIEDAKILGLKRLFTLTYEDVFFAHQGFRTITKDQLPSKVWSDCAACPKREACDEIAMIMEMDEQQGA